MLINKNAKSAFFPAEWEVQSGIMMIFPHKDTDWKFILDEVIICFIKIIKSIIQREKLLLVCHSIKEVKSILKNVDNSQIIFKECLFNDTWARDCAPLSVFINNEPYLLDFVFNGWGLKFKADYDDQLSLNLYKNFSFDQKVRYKRLNIILEGGSIENDGEGTVLTTVRCLFSINRNKNMNIFAWERVFTKLFGIRRILWLHHGFLLGDDTDSHIDTLVRFCDPQTITYVQCTDTKDIHFKELYLMEKELQSFKTIQGLPYNLIPLPMAEPVYFKGNRLPATYANFLILNDAVLMPIYKSFVDAIAKSSLQKAFPDKKIIEIDSLSLIKQNGSIHCSTMQFPKKFLS